MKTAPSVPGGQTRPSTPQKTCQHTLGEGPGASPASQSALQSFTALPSREQPTLEEQMESSKGKYL